MTLKNKLAIVGVSGLVFTGAAFGLAGIAAAQDNGDPADQTTDPDYEGYAFGEELSAEDKAVFEQFGQCMVDNGFDAVSIDVLIDDDGLTEDELDELVAAIEPVEDEADAALEACESILDDVSDKAMAGLDALEHEVYGEGCADDDERSNEDQDLEDGELEDADA